MSFKQIIFITLLILQVKPALAVWQMEIMPAVSSRQYEGEDAETGMSVHSHFTRYISGKGLFTTVYLRGNVYLPDVTVGYGWRKGSKSYYEFGAGIRYYVLGGVGGAVHFSIGKNLSGKTYISLPFIYRVGGGFGGLMYVPHIGYKF